MSEIEFNYRHFCWFVATSAPSPEWAMDAFSRPLPVSTDKRALKIARNMFGGPIRFSVVVDADEASVAAEFGPHDRYEADYRGDGSGCALQDLNDWAPVLDSLAPGDYRAVLLVSGIDPAKFDSLCEDSDERYLLLLQPATTSTTS